MPDRAYLPLCRRGPVALPQPCGPLMIVVAPTVLVPVVPTAAPANAAATAPATPGKTTAETPVVALTSASTGYEWNPNAAGTLAAARDSAGPPSNPEPSGNANLPLLTSPGPFAGALAGLGGLSRGGSARRLHDDDQRPQHFGASPVPPATFGAARGSSTIPPDGPETVAPTRDAEEDPGSTGPPVAAVPEPASMLATLTGLGVVAASAARRRRER